MRGGERRTNYKLQDLRRRMRAAGWGKTTAKQKGRRRRKKKKRLQRGRDGAESPLRPSPSESRGPHHVPERLLQRCDFLKGYSDHFCFFLLSALLLSLCGGVEESALWRWWCWLTREAWLALGLCSEAMKKGRKRHAPLFQIRISCLCCVSHLMSNLLLFLCGSSDLGSHSWETGENGAIAEASDHANE